MFSRSAAVALLVLALGGAVSAQTLNPRTVEFAASPDHSVTLDDGRPLVTSYALQVFVAGASQPFHTVNFGKPTPDALGNVKYDFSSQVSAWPLPGGIYEARIGAVGPFGSTQSGASNQFTFGTACAYSVSTPTLAVGAAAGTATVTLSVTAGCYWTATSNDEWVTVSVPSGTGSATISLSYEANPLESPRSATVTIGGRTVTLTQAGASCSFSVSPTSASVTADEGTLDFNVTATTGCLWSAASSADWLIPMTDDGLGSGVATFWVEPNPTSASRTGQVTVAGRTISVSQPGNACPISLSLSIVTVKPDAGSVPLTVTAPSGCTWSAASSASWLSPSPASDTGNATVLISYAATPSISIRTGTVTIGGRTLTVTQESARCAYAVSPATSSAPATAGTVGFSVVATPAECSWTAASRSPWVTPVNAAGTGAGQATFSFPTNPSSVARLGALVVGGQSVTVTQNGAPCTYSLSKSVETVDSGAGTGAVTLTTVPGCTWSTSSSAAWLTMQAQTGTGSANLIFTFSANLQTANRTATIVIGGQTLTITQAGASCPVVLSPTSTSVSASGGTLKLSVTAAAGCWWTASSLATWLSPVKADGSGNGTVTFAAAANTFSLARSSTIAVGGAKASVNQSGAACTVTLSSSAATLPLAGGTGSVSVKVPTGCSWKVTSSAAWLAPSPQTGTGTATMRYTAAKNTAWASRTATLDVNGAVLTVTQGLEAPPGRPKNPRVTSVQQ